MLENLVNDEFTGVYEVNITILYYKDSANRVRNRKVGLGLGLGGFEGDEIYDEPADLVIPVGSDGDAINWFRIEDESNVGSKSIMIPMNARKVVLELFVSSHGDDEFWYSNPPNSYILANNLTTTRGNGAFREVFVKIDGSVVASEVPFPVVYPGGLNPLFWQPVVAIGAFDLPSYDFDLTSVLGSLLDGKIHNFEVGVTNAIKYWYVDANLHVWLDKDSSGVQANVGVVKPPEVKQSFEYDFEQLDGSFEIEVERKSQSLGWVASSGGNFTTSIEKTMKFKNKMKYKQNGAYKVIKQKVKVKMEMRVISETGSTVSQSTLKRKYPLTLIISTLPGPDIDINMMITNISHSLNDEFSNGMLSSSVYNSQDAGGWVLLKNHSVLLGVGETHQNLSYRGSSGCFTRSVQASGGRLVKDVSAFACSSLFQKVLNRFFDSW